MAVAAPPVPRRPVPADAAAVAIPAALSAVLSLISLTGRSLGFDEAATVAIVSQHGHALFEGIAHDGGNMSGYYLLMHVLVDAFGDGPVVLRLPSVLFTVATVALVAALGRALFDRRVAWLAGMLSAISLPLVYWAQTARGYAPMLTFTCAGMLAFVALVRADERDAQPWWPAIAYVVAMTLAAYCSFVAVLIVPAQLLVLVHRRRAARRLVAALLAMAACCIPLAILAVRRGSGQLFWLARPGHQVETQVMQELTGAGLQSTFHRVVTTTVGWIVTSVALILIIALVLRAHRATRGGSTAEDPLASWGVAAVLSWALVPGALAFVYSLVGPQPIFLPRNLLISVPAVALVLAPAICDRRLPRWAAAIALLAALLIRLVPVAASYGVSPEPWRQATAQVLASARSGDCIAFYPEDGRNVFRYYVSRDGAAAAARAPRAVLPAIGWTTVKPFVEVYASLSATQITGLRSRCRRMWLVSSHEGEVSGPVRSREHRAEWHALRARLARAFGHGAVRTLGYASAIHVQLLPSRR